MRTLRNRAFILLLGLVIALTRPVNSQAVDDQYLAGCAYSMQGDFNQAITAFSLAIARNNADEQLYINRGKAYLELNEIDQAIEDFKEANLINSHVADILLAKAFARNGDVGNALKHIESHLQSDFRLPADSIKKDPGFDAIQESPEWYTIWQKEWYTDAEKVIAEAVYYHGRQQYDQAISLLDNALLQTPDDIQLLLQRGSVFQSQGNYAGAIADYSAVMKKDKLAKGVVGKRANAYFKSGRYKDAVADFNKAIREDPGNFGLYLQRADAFAGQQLWSQSIKDMKLYMKYFEQDLSAVFKCGGFYFEAGDYINALKCFNQNLKEDPNNGTYYKARGKTYYKTATYQYALSDLSMSLDLMPGDAETWMYLGLCKIQTGSNDKGCSDLERAQRMGSTEAVKYLLQYCR
ncbi:MAG: tetratricopeptide repeat protein [Bacteroidales bacterium]|nr:tetratricopeptide repeat protein [Bacteroidales bacterium]